MIINHNMNAMNAHRLMMGNTNQAGKSMEKLSSGLRINRAGDDAAGLAISEKMRAQIRGLDQASRNAQDGVSLIQTAEGALSETHSILQRMRELSTQASNDTNVEVDRGEIQKEMNQLTSEINRIGNTTEFNTKKLLSSGVSSKDRENIVKGLKEGWLEMAEKRIETNYGLTGTGKTVLKVTLSSNGVNGELAHVGGNSAEFELNIDVDDFKPGIGADGTNAHGKLYNDRIIAHEMTHAVMIDSLGADKTNTMPTWFMEGTAEFMAGADERLKDVIGDGSKTVDSKVTTLKNAVVRLLNGDNSTWKAEKDANLKYSAAYVAVKYLSSKLSSANDMKGLMAAIKGDAGTNGKDALEAAIKSKSGFAKGISDLAADFGTKGETFIKGLTLEYGKDESDVGAIGAKVNAEGVLDESAATDKTDGNPLKHFAKITWPDETLGSSEVKLQIGANEGQSFTIKLRDMRASALKISGGSSEGEVTSKDGTATAKYTKINNVTNGTDNVGAEYALDVSNHDNASAAIKIVNDAIENVSSFRSELGAHQNRLEHTINNLENSSENLTAAESRIRDVDMASEMMTFSKKNILSQAAQAMLAQANQQPQGVLQLLR